LLALPLAGAGRTSGIVESQDSIVLFLGELRRAKVVLNLFIKFEQYMEVEENPK
jgi:hypothetical protein